MHLFNNDDGKTVNMELPKKDDVLASLRFRHLLLQQRLDKQIKKAEEEKEEAALKAKEEKEKAALKAKEEKDEAALKLKKATKCIELSKTMLVNMDKNSKEELSLKKELVKALTNAADAQLALKDTQLTISRAGEEAAEIRVQSTLQDGIESLEAETKLKVLAEDTVARLQNRVTTLEEDVTLQGKSLEAETKLKVLAEDNVARLQSSLEKEKKLKVEAQTLVTTLQEEKVNAQTRVAALNQEETKLKAKAESDVVRLQTFLEKETNLKAKAESDVVRLQTSLGEEKKLKKEASKMVDFLHEKRCEEKETSEQNAKGLQFKYEQTEKEKKSLKDNLTSTTNDLMNANGKLKTSDGKLKTSEKAKVALNKKLQETIKALALAKDGTHLEYVTRIDKNRNYKASKLQELTDLAELLYKKFLEKDLPKNKDNEDFPFPLKEVANGGVLLELEQEIDTIVEIKSDQILFRTFNDLIWKIFFNDKSPETYDIFLSFNGWIGTNFFDPRNALNCTIRKKRKRNEVSPDSSGVNTRSKPTPTSVSTGGSNSSVNGSLTSSPTGSTTSTTSTSTSKSSKFVGPGKIKLKYNATGNEKAGSLINWTGNHGGVRRSEPILLYGRKKPITDGIWWAYKLTKDETGKLRCPFCEDSFSSQGFTNHVKGCTQNPKSKKYTGSEE